MGWGVSWRSLNEQPMLQGRGGDFRPQANISILPLPSESPPSSFSVLQFYLKLKIMLQESEAVPELCTPVPVPDNNTPLLCLVSRCHCPGLTSGTGSGFWPLSGSMICLPAVLISNDRKLNLLRLKNTIRMSQDWKIYVILPGFKSSFKILAHSPNCALAAPLGGCCNRSCSVQGAAGTVLQQFRMWPAARVPPCCCNVHLNPALPFSHGAFGDFGSAEGTSSGLMGEWGLPVQGSRKEPTSS